MIDLKPQNLTEPIAIIGMAGRFPGAATLDQFWQNIANGVESVSRLTDQDLLSSGINPEIIADPDYVKVRAVLDDADRFDCGLFGFTPRDADITDPQQRVFLEVCYEALESAGCDPERCPESIGVFAGCSMNTYLLSNVLQNREQVQDLVGGYQVSNYNIVVGNDKDYLATRLAYKLDLKGPAITVQSACSTSLVAVCQAVESLRSGKCDIAIAGGVSITFPQHRGYLYEEGGMASSDGHCRTFDADASGTVFGSGAVVVVLKRLDDAIKDGDTIDAVIRGVGINNDGSHKVSYMAPSVDGQAEAIAMAMRSASVDPETIGYVEAHGTGTPLGDPIEIAGLTKAYRSLGAARRQYCAIGSLKSNIGHLAEASGAAGLVKTVLALKHAQIPPTVHFRTPNPSIEFETSPFYVTDHLIRWESDGTPRRAGVSSFGVGGTNAHVVIEEAPAPAVTEPSARHELIVLSAKTTAALERIVSQLAAFLESNTTERLADIAYTLQTGRRELPHRTTIVVSSHAEAVSRLRSISSKSGDRRITSGGKYGVGFMFPGQGSQHPNMALELYDSVATFRADVDACCKMLQADLALDLRNILFPSPDETERSAKLLTETRLTQPALFTIEYAMAMLWMDWGIMPDSMIGHSVGEYVAATLSGVFTLPDALRLVAARGRLMQAQPAGSMLAVRMPFDEVKDLLTAQLSIAAINSPVLTVVSGSDDAISELEGRLQHLEKPASRLHTSHAFHSAMMKPMLSDYRACFSGVHLSKPTIPFISNITGTWITPEQAQNPEYWVEHVMAAVAFAGGISTLFEDEQRTLLEVGPGNSLFTLALQNAGGKQRQVYSISGHVKSGISQTENLIVTLGKLWEGGASVNWDTFHQNVCRRHVHLPTYPFERNRHWVEPVNVYGREKGI